MSNEEVLHSGSRTAVGLFVALGLALALLIGAAMGYHQGWFRKTFTLYVESGSAEGLKPGMSVRLSGIAVGKVAAIELTGNARIRMALHVGENFHNYLHADTQAHLAREGLFGDAYIVLQSDNRPGQPAAALVEDGARIPFEEGLSLGEMVAQIKNKVFPLLDQLHGVAQKLNDDKGHFQGSLQDTQALLRHLKGTLDLLDANLKNTARLTGEQVPQSLAHLNASLDGVAGLAGHADARLQVLEGKLEGLVQTAGESGDAAGKAALELRGLLQEARQALRVLSGSANGLMLNGNRAVSNLQTHWPFTGPAGAASVPVSAPVSAPAAGGAASAPGGP